MKRIGTFAGSEISLDFTDGVKLVLEWPSSSRTDVDVKAISGLLSMLGGARRVWVEGDSIHAEIPYTDALDHRLLQLIDLLIEVRFSHPRMIQLPLALSEAEAAQLERILGADAKARAHGRGRRADQVHSRRVGSGG